MTSLSIYVLLGVAIALVAWIFLVWRGVTQDWLPPDLAAGRVVLVEKNLYTNSPYCLAGRPDQVYRLQDGSHVPVELKNHTAARVYDTDVAQLSLQAWMLRRNGMKTAPHGYVALQTPQARARRAIRVQLHDDAFCESLIARYLAIIEGRRAPQKSRGPKCKTCGHFSICTR